MATNYLPSRESQLVTWTQGFATLIDDNAAEYGLTDGQATAYVAARSAFVVAYNVANEQTTRSPANIEIKNTAKETLVAETRRLVKIIQASPVMNDDKRAALGVTIPDTNPTPVPPPEFAPQLDVVSVTGRTVKLRLRDAETGKRKKPIGVQGATVLSYVGATIPESLREWTFETNDTRLDTQVTFGDGVATGSKVWLTAFWFNRRGESGPAAAPISTHVGFGVTSEGGEGTQADAA